MCTLGALPWEVTLYNTACVCKYYYSEWTARLLQYYVPWSYYSKMSWVKCTNKAIGILRVRQRYRVIIEVNIGIYVRIYLRQNIQNNTWVHHVLCITFFFFIRKRSCDCCRGTYISSVNCHKKKSLPTTNYTQNNFNRTWDKVKVIN